MSIGQIHQPRLVGGWCCPRNDLMKLLFNYQYSLMEVEKDCLHSKNRFWKQDLWRLLSGLPKPVI